MLGCVLEEPEKFVGSRNGAVRSEILERAVFNYYSVDCTFIWVTVNK